MLAVVIPVLDHLEDTRLTIATLQATTVCDVIIVDDGSSADVARVLPDLCDVYLRNPSNLGVNHSWNVGIRSAIAGQYDHICVANNDLAFSPGWWRPLRRALEDGYALVSPYSTMGALPADWPDGGARRTNPCSDVMDILGACFCFAPSLIERIGFVPEDMRHYCGDNWFAEACRREGLAAGHIEASYVHHFGMHTTRALPGSQLEADRRAYEAYKRRAWSR